MVLIFPFRELWTRQSDQRSHSIFFFLHQAEIAPYSSVMRMKRVWLSRILRFWRMTASNEYIEERLRATKVKARDKREED